MASAAWMVGLVLSLALGLVLGVAVGTRRERGRLERYLAVLEAETEARQDTWKARGGVKLHRVVFRRTKP